MMMMISKNLKSLSFELQKSRYISSSKIPFLSLHTNPQDHKYEDIQVDAIYNIISNSTSSQNLKQSLKSTGVFLSNDLIDKVLKRARFSHGNPLQALDFFNFTANRRGFYHSSYSLDTMLYILGRSRRFDHIWDVLIDIKRKDRNLITPRTLQVVLGRVAKVCSVRMTVESFWKFKRLVPVFDTSCFNALLRTLCQEKSMSDARNSSEEAELFFDEMKELGVKPDIVTYNSLIDVFCKGRELEKAYGVVEKMNEEGILPDVITYTSIIGGLGLVGQPDKARDMLKEMKEHGCYPDVAAYNAVIRNYCIAKRLDDAYSLMAEMTSKGMSPNATSYNFLFKRNEKVEMALQLWNDMVEKGFGSYILVSDVLFDLLCDMGKLVEAEKCFLQMVEKGHKPSNVSFRRIKVLMELAKKHDAIQNLSEKMAIFGSSIRAP
ncbi:hypothetical protein OIU78_028480 [Salix suchowensis]|nr:hypothetical protein OIU78_028480 [Salix suchowensis]